MIISAILGGIGNQMFQYAAARALALSRSEPLLIDLSGFEGYTLHQGYELQRVFSLEVNLASQEQIRSVLGWRSCSFIRRLLKQRPCAPFRGKHLAIEPHFNYWPGLAAASSPLYMMGYWQSERYIGKYEKQIREDFQFRHPLQGANAELATQMETCSSVSLHIRRGDYVTHKATSKIMGLCTLDYYREAVSYIAEHVSNPVYFVFSDDMEWVKQSVDFLPRYVLVDQNRGLKSYCDMQLMSTCRHHIIANSSFSWWGAWLNPASNKIVIAPKKWFRNNLDDIDLVPPRWVKL